MKPELYVAGALVLVAAAFQHGARPVRPGAVAARLPTWNGDTDIIKDIGVYRQRVGVMHFFTITNVLSHYQPGNPSFSLTTPTSFGQITSQVNTPRNMEFGVRVHF